MHYVSTRGRALKLGFCDAVLTGLASDAGLYQPESWPQLTHSEIAGFTNKPYRDMAFEIVSRFVGDEMPDTARPVKFPDAVQAACGVNPQLPDWLADLHERTERCDVLANDAGLLQEYSDARIRA